MFFSKRHKLIKFIEIDNRWNSIDYQTTPIN